ncbi:SHOCT domain-containing protein [Sphingobium sp.]|uniref:SHOCT domain-containing protein n=1 Tax=Sphingobium sp. TaxID=1912891 RepID=UPI002579B05D|nr:SHOCT domain-containing protein [Sphingobium sp.]MBR2266749.1 SHOCT domain-containing protein [Sphingobium sp.]
MTSKIEALERLAKLKSDGILSDAEFADQKAALLASDSAEADMSLTGRWKEGREKSRGIRRAFRWFWLAQLAIIVLVGIYFLTRGQTLQDARDATPHEQSNAVDAANLTNASEASDGAEPISSPTPTGISTQVTITDALLQNPWSYDGDNDGTNSADVCANGTIQIVNESKEALNLSVSELDTYADAGAIGELPSGSRTAFSVGAAKQYVMGRPIEGGAISLFMLNAVPCAQL